MVRQHAVNLLRLDGLYLDSGIEDSHRRRLNNIMYYGMQANNAVIFQSEFSKKLYQEFWKRDHDTEEEQPESMVIHNGVPDNYNPEDRTQNKKKTVVASASWRRHKRLEELVEAFKDPRLKNVNLFVLNGQDYWKNREIPDNVVMHGRVHPNSLHRYYKAADAMAHLCWLDSCPNSVVEALACGTPVLCSHNGGTKELVRTNGTIISLEETYKPGELVDLYNPPQVDTNTIVEGLLEVLEVPQGFSRPDLHINTIANSYLKAAEWAANL